MGPADAAQRHLIGRAATVGLLMRHSANLGVAVVTLATPASEARMPGRVLLVLLGCWALYRIVTRSQLLRYAAVDYALIIAVCAAMSFMVTDPTFYTSNSAPQAIAGTAVVSFAVVFPIRASLAMTVGLAVAYTWGAATVAGWDVAPSVSAIYYFFIQWGTSAAIRLILLRVAGAVDAARADREAAEVAERVTRARDDCDREQLALLHDTVASTLMLVGQGTPLPPARLAAQATRDLEVLRSRPWIRPARTELVAALRSACAHAVTPLTFIGRDAVWLDGETAAAVTSAAREAVTNVDRHAEATAVVIDVDAGHVKISDDGVGFDGQSRPGHHGLPESIHGRMARVGGVAQVKSVVGGGSSVYLHWASGPPDKKTSVTDPDRLIERVRVGFGLTLCGFAMVNLVVTVPYSLPRSVHPGVQLALGALAALAALAAITGIGYRMWWPAWPAAVMLLGVTVAQALTLDSHQLGGQAHWAQGAIGWCLVPLLLAIPLRHAATVLTAYWVIGSLMIVLGGEPAAALLNVGLGTASILSVQLYALVFNDLMRGAARDTRAETDAQLGLLTRERVAQAVQADYQQRYADLVDSVLPLMSELTLGARVSPELRHQARSETHRLRTLFDQSRSFNHPLMKRIRAIVDDVEARGVDVSIHVDGGLSHLDERVIDRLMDPVAELLSGPVTSARLVLTAADGGLTASVVCELEPGRTAAEFSTPAADDGSTIVAADGMVWLTQVA